MDTIKIFAAITALSLIIFLLKNYKAEYALLAQLMAVVVIGFIVVSGAERFIDTVGEIASLSTDAASFLKILFKALAISVLCDIASSFCADSSNNTLSKSVELIGKTAILSLSLPLLKEFLESIISFLR